MSVCQSFNSYGEERARNSNHNILTSFSERTQDNYIDRLCRKRRNVLQILHYGNVIPFNWHTKGFRCFYCSKPMRDCETLKEHTTKHIVDLPSFIAKSIISKDIPVKLDVSNLSCKLCIGTPIQNLEELITHIVEVHEEDYDRTLGVCAFPFVLTKDIMQCVLCKNMYDNFTCMVGHMYKDHINHSFICQICGYSFITKIRLKRHINNSHVGFRCSVCGKMFNAAHRLIKHKEKIHGQANTRECNLCSATFESQYLLKVHLGKMHNVEKYRIKCEYCPKVCSTKGAMILHVQSQHSESKFECDLCNYKTGIKWLITLHKKKHFGDRDYACSICEKMFRRSSNLRSHMKVHSGTSGRVCRLCRRGFVDLDTLNAHKREQKKGRQGTTANDLSSEDYDQAITTSSVDTKQPTAKDKRNIMRNNVIQVLTKSTVMPFRWLKSSYRCFYCYDIFQEPSELKRHQENHVGDEIKIQAMKNYWESVVYVDVSNLSCSLCPEIVTDLNNLIDHLITSHNVDYNKDAGVCMVAFKLDNFNVSCLACGANFYTFGPLLHHTNKDHKGTSAILCDICGQNFKDASLLRLHVKSVHENAIYLCTECGEKFDSKSKLRTHQKNSHDVEKKYKCADCSEVFHSMYKRSQHMASEHKNRPQIKCPHCPKTFVFRSMMMTHLRDSHLKFRNHVCGVCGWKAFNSNRLKNHMYKHSGEKNFKCDACDKAFTTKKIMRAHFARMHKNPQPMLQYENPYGQV
uniref:SFRICE_008914 n=1 Tax=Spodoptera frugiperda TaxID=7108 RepID=A0A2H1VCK4_SPOFR